MTRLSAVSLPHFLLLASMLPSQYWAWMATTRITYCFLFPDGRSRVYEVVLDAETGRQVSVPLGSHHAWTDLEYEKCRHCPLKREEHPECPAAKNLAFVVDDFQLEQSFEKVLVEVVTAERTYRKEVPIQDGLFSLVGLIMSTSACPHLDFLRPMARFHLPFSTSKETTVRSVSFYLLRQYFAAKQGCEPDYRLTELQRLYDAIGEVNLGMAARMRSASKTDAQANAIVVLDLFAQLLLDQVNDKLSSFEMLFSS